MGVAFSHTRRRYLNKLRFRTQLFNRSRSAVTHTSSQPPDELVNEWAQRTFERDAPFNTFGNKFAWNLSARPLSVTFA